MAANLIENLRDLRSEKVEPLGMSVKSMAPATDKYVIVQVRWPDDKVQTIGARYREGRWYGDESGDDLTDEIMNASQAIWMESLLFTDKCVHTHENTK